METLIQVGDIVCLKSDTSMKMTVTSPTQTNNFFECGYFYAGEFKTIEVHIMALRKIG